MDKGRLSPETITNIECLLRETSNIVNRKGREILTHFSITPPQFFALIWLKNEGDLTIGELSQRMYLACSTMTDLIDRMEKNQLVARVRDERDRRVIRVHLLKRGMSIYNQVIKARKDYLAKVLSDVSEKEAQEIQDYLGHIYQRMKENEIKGI